MSASPAEHAFEHVQDSKVIDIFPTMGWTIPLPNIFGFQITKFMLLEVLAAVLIYVIYTRIAKRAASGEAPKGYFWNAFETLLTYIRDEVAKPYIGHEDHHTHEHEADKYVPYLWTVFLFILFCNLFGMFPFLGSPTADLGVTAAMALCSFALIFFVPMLTHGPVKFFKSFWPNTEIKGWVWIIAIWALLGVWVIEVLGLFIKSAVLAVRLFANMFGGHTVIAFFLVFIEMVKESGPLLFWGVSISTVVTLVAISLLELFVAFLQAFVFTFLTALFFGSTLHPEH